jgi:hypothetical protein
MRKKWGRFQWPSNYIIMENKFGLIELTENELKECNGGSIIAYFLASNCVKRLIDFVEGVKEGYERATSTP